MNARVINWVWHIRGSLGLAPGQSIDQVFRKLDPLFRQPGTSHERTANTLTFRKKGQAAQDKMSVFDAGILRIENSITGTELHYNLTSRALLLCFLAPLLFLGFAQLTIFVAKLEKPATEGSSKGEKAMGASKMSDKKHAQLQQNPIDKFLGSPAPEKSKTGDKDKNQDDDKKKPSPTSAYVFAGIFATLYVVGRVLEGRLVKALFRSRLLGP